MPSPPSRLRQGFRGEAATGSGGPGAVDPSGRVTGEGQIQLNEHVAGKTSWLAVLLEALEFRPLASALEVLGCLWLVGELQ
jgi:hypothetical protein